MKFTYQNYNFNEDNLCKEFIEKQKNGKRIPYRNFHSYMSKLEREYLKVLNSSHLRRLHNIPDDWGYQFMVGD